MFDLYFKNKLKQQFILDPNVKSAKIVANSWNAATVKEWMNSDPTFEANLTIFLQDKQLSKLLAAAKLQIDGWLKEFKAEFQTVFKNCSIDILESHHEYELPEKGERALDAVCRLLMAKLANERPGCVCAAIHPLYHVLIVTANNGVLSPEKVRRLLNEIVAEADSDLEKLQKSNSSIKDIKQEISDSWQNRKPKIDQSLMEKRLLIDRVKYREMILAISALPIRTPFYDGAHADIQLIEYVEYSLKMTAMRSMPMYLGDGMLCCPKCETLIRLYNSCGLNKIKVRRRGWHSTYDMSGWGCTPRLRHLITHGGQRQVISNAIDSLILAELSSKSSMHADLSDSED